MRQRSYPDAETRANLSCGISDDAIYRMVQGAIHQRRPQHDGVVIDGGCGAGGLWQSLSGQFQTYIGVDAVKYDGFPENGQFWKAEFNSEPIDLPDHSADVVACVETIEHVENPRALARERVRLAKPGGWIIITTPNQLAFASLACLLLKRNFQHFQEGGEGGYPTHIFALLEIDLIRIARENSLTEIAIDYTNRGRIPFTGTNWPAMWPFRDRRFSDNIMVVARKPESFAGG